MNREEIIAFINAHRVFYLATAEDGQPRVRAMALHRADDAGILFQTMGSKDLWRQIQKNPRVEICCNDVETNVQMRVAGVVEIVDDQALKEQVLKERPFLKGLVEKQGWDAIKLFRITRCKAYVWTMEKNFAPKEWVAL
jgi:pyridoxamine 5'-phosphate oxidase